MPFPLSRKVVPGLSAGGQVVLYLSVNGGDLQLSPHGRLVEGDGLLIQHRGPVPLELGMGLDMDAYDQIAGRTAVLACIPLSAQRDSLAVIDAGGDGHSDALLLPHAARPPAGLAGAVDDLAGPPALGAGRRTGEGKAARPPLDADGPGAPAVRADLRCGP